MNIDKNKKIQNIKLWEDVKAPVEELKPLCRKIGAEGSVLLKNDGVLPFAKGTRIALFGRNQEGYIKSGTGSGGLVRLSKQPCIWDSFAENGVFELDEELIEIYKDWIVENPFDNGHGWATEPWCQKEMPITKELAVQMAHKNDAAVIIIGRTAGEDKDNSDTEGSYRLTADETQMIKNVSSAFKKTVVVLNVGNLIDLSFMDDNNISALLYIWQGGQEGANALADVLSGKCSPSGKLPDTQVYNTADYPSLEDFGNKQQLIYSEDIYVGYRYFETFKKDGVRYPFGFGLTYTNFDVSYSANEKNKEITVNATVKNTGNFTAKEVVQVYFGAPCGKLGTPEKQLIGFAKTKDLKPNEEQTVTINFSVDEMASYDDSGVTGNKSCYVLEAGNYKIYVGTDVRSAKEVLNYTVPEITVTEQLEEIMTSDTPFKRIKAQEEQGERKITYEAAPLKNYNLEDRIKERRSEEISFTGDKDIKLVDVWNGKNSIEEFVAQMTDNDLCIMVCGEGMNSPKVTPGTGAAFGGVTNSLLDLGIPICCVTDGPSGLRIGNDYKATSLPNGYVFASSFDEELTEQIFELEGIELFRYDIDALLGPGMNIHRHPLCGRNFEYFSEDPYLSGKIAAAQTRGMKKSGATTTIKHFCGNNQELGRASANDIVSERALREIYLKGFEIAVKEGGATALMTSYNPVNGYHSASNYDLTTTVLRKEWGYEGFVMTDWWARANCKKEIGEKDNLKAMVRAQNDIYMVNGSSASKSHNILSGLQEGFIVRSDLQRCVINLLNYIMDSPTFAKFVDGGCIKPRFSQRDMDKLETVKVLENVKTNEIFEIEYGGDAAYIFEFVSNTDSLAQSQIILTVDDSINLSFSVSGTDGKIEKNTRGHRIERKMHTVKLQFPPAVEIKKLIVKM